MNDIFEYFLKIVCVFFGLASSQFGIDFDWFARKIRISGSAFVHLVSGRSFLLIFHGVGKQE